HLGNRSQLLRPFPPKDAGAARGGYGEEALPFEDQAVELALADDQPGEVFAQMFPPVELGPAAGGGKHLRMLARILRVLGEFEEGDLPGAIEDRDRDPAAVPAEQVG